jgi:ubiquinone/menaquinone biosynthesis C-methylase UbiE
MMNSALQEALSARGAMRSVAEAQERIGALPVQVTMREAWLGHSGIGEGHRVLDVGCGTGVASRDVARAVGTFGKVVAIDPSEALLQVAGRLAAQAGISSRIDFRLGDVAELGLPPQSFDHAVASLVFQHLSDPRAALLQVRRVLRPGAGIVCFEQDVQALAVDHPDRGLTRIILQHAAEHYVLSADAARRLPGLYAELGFQGVDVLTFLQAERNEDGMLFDLLRRLAEFAAARGRIRAESARSWVETLCRKAAEGSFFASLPHYAVLGRKPTFAAS